MIILASQSPRRKEILTMMGFQFKTIPSNYDESLLPSNTKTKNVPKLLAHFKAEQIHKSFPNDIVIGSDTIVVVGNKILGKPKDKKDARSMLLELSNKTHKVITGVSIFVKDKEYNYIDIASVTFNNLSFDEIENYLNTDEPYDKAGSYAIQGIGIKFIKKIKGDYYTIMGLPTKRLYKILNRAKK